MATGLYVSLVMLRLSGGRIRTVALVPSRGITAPNLVLRDSHSRAYFLFSRPGAVLVDQQSDADPNERDRHDVRSDGFQETGFFAWDAIDLLPCSHLFLLSGLLALLDVLHPCMVFPTRLGVLARRRGVSPMRRGRWAHTRLTRNLTTHAFPSTSRVRPRLRVVAAGLGQMSR